MQNNKLWFKAKMYGWGWQPTSWEGFVVVGLYVAALIQLFISINKMSHSGSDALINFALPFIVITIFFLIICYAKGERSRWRWGK